MRLSLLVSALVLAAGVAGCATSTREAQRPATPAAARSPIASDHPFEVKGTVKSVGDGLLGMGRSVTIARDGAPAAELHVAEETRVTLDDRPAKLSDLREGDEIRARFDFDKSTPVAIELQAKPKRR
jgi:hypothetical protein